MHSALRRGLSPLATMVLLFSTLVSVSTASAQGILYRVNAGGPAVAAIDGGIGWDADTNAIPSSFRVAGGGSASSFPTSSANGSVPSSTPPVVFNTERWDPAAAPEMLWSFPTGPGTYEVRLYLKNGFDGTSGAGTRQFDVVIEGNLVLDDLDMSATYGHRVGAMESFLVTSDATLDIEFVHVLENPLVNAIEILSADANGFLQPSTNGVDFGLTETFTTSPATSITLTNAGQLGDQDVTISSVNVSGEFQTSLIAQTLLPGGDVTFDVSFAPTTAGVASGTITITHDGSNSPLEIGLTGEGFDPGAAPISFSASGLASESSNNPTSLDFGPDDRLYVAQQNGTIYAYTVERVSANNYAVTNSEQILEVKNIPNHDDDGTLNASQGNRQVTGLMTAGTASNPVLYVTSSDPRIGAGGGGNDTALDTNSGIISRLTWTGSSWDHVQLVRGLPRSEENHATNGLDLDEVSNVLYVMSGGHTNKGAPSNNFAQTQEYALSAALLSVDLDMLEAMPVLVDGNGSQYVYDLPTLDDPSRGTPGQPDPGDPFGGNDGRNQAIWDLTGPVQVYSPGYRNAYDVVFTSLGRLYTFDNGPNSGWGGLPIGEATTGVTNESNESNSTGYGDGLHFVSGPGYYGGHPNPTRANPAGAGLFVYEDVGGTWTLSEQYDWTTDFSVPPVPFSAANPAEADYLIPGVEDQALAVINSSTNGIAEYTASNFGGQMQGNLLAAAFNGNVYRFVLNGAGNIAIEQEALLSGFGSQPLDVIALGDDGLFPGTIWAATYGADNITVFEPVDYDGGTGSQCTGANDPLLDEDNDGYSNADEIAAGTDPCSGGSKPIDNDGDFVSDITDTDDDNDGILDPQDPFAWDPNNGTATDLPFSYTLFNQDPGTGFFGLGFTGLMTNGTTDYLDQFDENNLAAGGASGKFTIELVSEGDAYQNGNDQENAFQFGVNVDTSTPAFYARTRLEPPYFQVGGQQNAPSNFMSYGVYLGNGGQDDYLKLVMNGNGSAGLQVLLEVAGTASQTNYGQAVVGDLLAASGVELFLLVDPATLTVQPQVSLDNGATRTDVGPAIVIPAAWLDPNDAQGLAIGIISTSTGAGPEFGATWDLIEVGYEAADTAAFVSVVADSDINSSTFGNDSFQVRNDSPGAQRITSLTFDLSTAIYPNIVFDPNGTAGDDGGRDFTENTNGGVGTATAAFSQPRGNGGFDVLQVDFTEFDPGEQFGFSVDIDPASIEGATPPGPNESGSVSGLELVGGTVVVTFDDGSIQVGELYSDGSAGGSEVTLASNRPAAPGISFPEIDTVPSVVNFAEQTLRLTGPADASVRVLQVEGGLFVLPGGGVGAAPFEANSAIVVQELTGLSLDNTGVLDLQVSLSRSDPDAGINTFVAVIDEGGTPGFLSQILTLEYDPNAPEPSTLGASPNPLAFGPTDVGVGATADLTLFHGGPVGEDDITIASVAISGADAADFTSTPNLPIVLAPGDSSVITVDFLSTTIGSKSASLSITHDGSNSPLAVALSGTATTATPGDVVYRINSGGPQLAAADGSTPVWSVDASASPSPFVNAADTGNQTADSGATVIPDATVPTSVPAALFSTERYDLTSTVAPLTFALPVTAGEDYELRLYFAETFDQITAPDLRVFDVAVEGQPFLTAFDVFAETGGLNIGTMRSIGVTAQDDTLDVVFGHVAQNPSIKGLELVQLQGATGGQALIEVTPSGGLGASTYSNGSIQITNQSEPGIKISGVSFLLRTAHLPDMVFDPNGLAGDTTAKCLQPNSGATETGFVAPGDPCVDPFSLAKDNGFEAMLMEFDDFDPAETATFSVDVDPTSIQGASASNIAGAVSGLELAGAVVTVNFDNGQVVTTELTHEAGNESLGKAVARAGLPAAPNLEIIGATNPSDVSVAAQTARVVGPVGATVKLLVMEAALDPSGAPNGGFDLDPYEANKALVVTTPTATIGEGGTVDIPITLTNTDPQGGLNYVTAVIDDGSGGTGLHSQTWVLDYDLAFAAFLTADDDTLAFGDQPVGSPATSTVRLRHDGDPAAPSITITALNVTGPNAAEFSVTNPATLSLAPGDSIDVEVTYAPEFNGPKAAALQVQHDGQDSPTLVTLTGSGSGGDDPVWVYRVNAGGPELAAIDNGPVWSADTTGTPSPWVDTTASGNVTYGLNAGSSVPGPIDLTDPSIAPTTPASIFDIERYTQSTGQLVWNFPVTPGNYEVRLFFAEIFGDATAEGDRVFDVIIEGTLQLDDFDQVAEAGAAGKGLMRSFTVAVDDTLDIDLVSVVENAAVKGIEILEASPTTDVGDVPGAAPTRFALEQNKPNPFNPRTKIAFSLTEQGPVALRIFDVSGRLVDVLQEGELAAGHHQFVWDGVDRAGRRVATGVYFYRLESAEGTVTRKMTLIK